MNVRPETFAIEERNEWRWWVTPVPLKDAPIHRWYFFPHSFTGNLVHALIDEWGLGDKDHILDPFCGAGTTLVAAKQKGVPANGYDLSPFAVLVSNVKAGNYSKQRLNCAWGSLKARIAPSRFNGSSRAYPELVRDALPGNLLTAFDAIWTSIQTVSCSQAEKRFFQLAVLRSIRHYSRLIPTGGWLSWTENRSNTRSIVTTMTRVVEEMIEDINAHNAPRTAGFRAAISDARSLPDADDSYSAVITSPPYPNRHDYTRVFGVELMFGFLNWSQTRSLRYQCFESHPEAHPHRPNSKGYTAPPPLEQTLSRLNTRGLEPRIVRMLRGYFLDSYLCLKEAARVCRVGAHIAFVVGNAQYGGECILVDELTAEIGEQVGLRCEKLVAVRDRGNSAQQMGKFGRNPSRESVVVFEKPNSRRVHRHAHS